MRGGQRGIRRGKGEREAGRTREKCKARENERERTTVRMRESTRENEREREGRGTSERENERTRELVTNQREREERKKEAKEARERPGGHARERERERDRVERKRKQRERKGDRPTSFAGNHGSLFHRLKMAPAHQASGYTAYGSTMKKANAPCPAASGSSTIQTGKQIARGRSCFFVRRRKKEEIRREPTARPAPALVAAASRIGGEDICTGANRKRKACKRAPRPNGSAPSRTGFHLLQDSLF